MEFAYRRTYRGPFKAIILDLVGSAFDYGSFAPSAVFLRLLKSRASKSALRTPDQAWAGLTDY